MLGVGNDRESLNCNRENKENLTQQLSRGLGELGEGPVAAGVEICSLHSVLRQEHE